MRFRAHDTFFIRKGWLSKGMKNVISYPDVFISRENNPMDMLGIGANMVRALRYWLVAVGLTTEPNSGKRIQSLTKFGDVVNKNDPYFEEIGTLWLLHYHLVKETEGNDTDATAWWYFFNDFPLREFTKDDFIIHIKKYLRSNGEDEKSDRTLEDDFNCIMNTYIPRIKSNPKKINPESNIDCPLGELGLVDIVNKKEKLFKKSTLNKSSLHPIIVLAVIIDQSNGEKEIRISSLQSDNGNIGKVFNLDIISLNSIIYKIELLGHIKVVRTAGLDIIQIKTDWDFNQCVKEYYKAIN